MIHTSYTVGITTAEFLALQNVMTEQDTWMENCIQTRARLSIENITSKGGSIKITLEDVDLDLIKN